MPKYVVRHGVMRQLGVFSARGRDRYSRGHRVIARTSRGLEAGEVLCEASEHVLSQMGDPRTGQILRLESADDHVELEKLHEQRANELRVCRERIAELGLEMELVDVEHLYGGERVVVYYLAEARVDFRELVKLLARDFQTRIEMRQIGVRDEAKLLADYGDCGKPVCCNNHLSAMPPVSMKMAKLQKATLDPTKISGRCGRLKCCLRYEYDTYRDLQKDLPRVGAEIITNKGRAKVLAQEILTGQLLIQTEDMRRVSIAGSEVLSVVDVPRGKGDSANKKTPAEKESGRPDDGSKRSRAGGGGGEAPATPSDRRESNKRRRRPGRSDAQRNADKPTSQDEAAPPAPAPPNPPADESSGPAAAGS